MVSRASRRHINLRDEARRTERVQHATLAESRPRLDHARQPAGPLCASSRLMECRQLWSVRWGDLMAIGVAVDEMLLS